VVILTADKSKGDVTITAAHAEAGKAGTTTDANGDAITAGSSVTIKVPTLSVDKYGHTQFNGETSHTITIPNEVAVGDGDVTIAAGKGLTTGGTFNVNQDGDSTITIDHASAPTSGSNATTATGSGKTFISAVKVDDMGHVAGVETVATSFTTETSTASGKAQFTYNGTADTVEFVGTSNVKVSSDAAGKITIDDAHVLSKGADETPAEATQLTYGDEFTVMVDTTVDGHIITDVLGKFKLPAAITATDLGLSNAMHFIGAFTEDPANPKAGDVYLNTATHKEYVYDEVNKWVELGAEGSHALNSITITGTDGLTGGGDLTKNQTISHAVPTGAAAGSVGGTNSDMKFVAAITTDKFGHVTNKTEKTLDLSRFVLKDFDIKTGDGLTGGGAINGTDVTISHANTSDVTNVTKAARTYVTGMTFDQFGHVTAVETASEIDQDLSNYKTKQTVVIDPTSEGEAVDFIATIAQDENGNITATKKHVDFSDYVSLVYADGNYKKKQTAYTYTKGAEKIITGISQNANGEIAVTEGALTTDDIAGGTETWFFYCGTATEVMDTKPTV
jgi:hypothetical protein